jgi:hypothetical protein
VLSQPLVSRKRSVATYEETVFLIISVYHSFPCQNVFSKDKKVNRSNKTILQESLKYILCFFQNVDFKQLAAKENINK